MLKERVNGYITRVEVLKKAIDAKEHPAATNAKKKGKEDKDGNPLPKIKPCKKVNLEEEFAKLVGMDDIKSEILMMRRELMLDKRRRELGMDLGDLEAPHFAFYGNPGTGKTMIARLIASCLRTLEVVPNGQLVEVQRSDLVAGFVGQTGPKTKKVIDQAKGGILFVDEAYRLLGQPGAKSDFGPEAIEELMAVMNDGDPVMVFAGYEGDMARFFQSNEGLFRRVQRHFHFKDYSCLEIAKITVMRIKRKKFRCPEAWRGDEDQQLANVIMEHTSKRQRSMFNAAMAKRIQKLAKANLDKRLDIKATLDELMTFSVDDIVGAVKLIPEPPKKDETRVR
jgi:SpoVK/Ycf46/Vps4 family AAA+-type ATPase